MHDLNLLISSHQFRTSYPTRSECGAKSVRFKAHLPWLKILTGLLGGNQHFEATTSAKST